jgi:chemotaxis protein MotA
MDPDVVRNLLTTEIVSLEDRHALGQNIFKTMGTFAPAFGMLGTLMGLIAMLAKLNEPSKIGTGMAVALVTTFWGVVIANVVCLPIAGKLKMRSEEEVKQMELIMEGLSSIQAGDNPRTLQDKLTIFLAPHAREPAKQEGPENE